MEYIQSRSGCRQILFQGYNYNRERREAPNDPKSVWRCVEYSGPCQCPGRMTVIRGKPMTGAPHNHAPFSTKITVKRIMNRLKVEALDTSRDLEPSEIIEELTRDISEEVKTALPSGQIMRRMIQRLRNKDRGSGQSILQHQIKRLSRTAIKVDLNGTTSDEGPVQNGDSENYKSFGIKPADSLVEHEEIVSNAYDNGTGEDDLLQVEKTLCFWKKMGNLDLLPDFIQEIKAILDDIQKAISKDTLPPQHSQEFAQMIEYSKHLSFIVMELGLIPKLKEKLTHHQNCLIAEREKNRRELIALRKRIKAHELKRLELDKRTQCVTDLIQEHAGLLWKPDCRIKMPLNVDQKVENSIRQDNNRNVKHEDENGVNIMTNGDDQTSIFFGHGLSDMLSPTPTSTSAIFELGQALGIFHEGKDGETEIMNLKKSFINDINLLNDEKDQNIECIDTISSATISSVTSCLAPLDLTRGGAKKRIKNKHNPS